MGVGRGEKREYMVTVLSVQCFCKYKTALKMKPIKFLKAHHCFLIVILNSFTLWSKLINYRKSTVIGLLAKISTCDKAYNNTIVKYLKETIAPLIACKWQKAADTEEKEFSWLVAYLRADFIDSCGFLEYFIVDISQISNRSFIWLLLPFYRTKVIIKEMQWQNKWWLAL